MPTQLTASARVFRELVRLLAARLARTGYGKLARFASIAIAVGFVATVIVERSAGPMAGSRLQASAARTSLWLVGLAVALAASHQRSIADRRDGLELLADMRGLGGVNLIVSRAAAAFWVSARLMLVPALAVGLASIAASGSLHAAADGGLALAAVLLFVLAVSLVLPTLGAVFESLAPKRGRTLLVAVLIVSAAAPRS